jgi:predicted permease
MRLLRRLQYLLHHRRNAAELAEEMEIHREMAERDHRAAGLSVEDAYYSARRQLGNTARAGEDARRVWLPGWLERVAQDLRYAARSLIQRPGFTVLACLALGLGIGLNTSLFTVFNAVALRPWPVHDPGRVVSLLTTSPSGRDVYGGFSVAEYRYLREHSRTLSGAILTRSLGVHAGEQPDEPSTNAHLVSGNYFRVLGVGMTLGRGLTEDEDRMGSPQAVAVLSYRMWMTRFGGDPAIIGRSLRLDDVPFTIIGVAAEDFTGISPEHHDLWVPFAILPVLRPNDPSSRELLADPHWCCSVMAGRLEPGATRERAQAELNALAHQFQEQVGTETRDVVVSGTAFVSRPDEKVTGGMALFLAAVVAILLLACANVSNLLLARAVARKHEIAVRISLGAGRGRLIQQLLTESLVLALLAGSLGLLLAYVLPGFVLSRVTESPPDLHLQPDTTVLAFTAGVAILSAMIFGLAPALHGTRVSTHEVMKQQSANASPRFALRSVLLGVQVAISLVLLVSAGLLLRGVQQTGAEDPGFATSGVTLLSVALPASQYDEARSRAFFAELIERFGPLTGHAPIGLAALLPLGDSRMATGFSMPGQDPERGTPIVYQPVSAAYFEVLEIPVIAGRNFIPADAETHAVLVNESMARQLWPDRSPIGQAIHTGDQRREVVGVVRDAQLYGLGPVEPIFFEPYAGGRQAVVVLRSGKAAGAERVIALVRQMEPHAVASVTTISDQMERWLGPSRSGAMLAAALGLLALVLATVGVYGVIAYSVEQRQREIGVRLAVGAAPRQIVRLVLRVNARPVLTGLVVGAGVSLFVARLLRGTLSGVNGLDPLVWGGVLAILLFAGVAASVVPARRAARLDPVSTLRFD